MHITNTPDKVTHTLEVQTIIAAVKKKTPSLLFPDLLQPDTWVWKGVT